jgi:hypothetical protein
MRINKKEDSTKNTESNTLKKINFPYSFKKNITNPTFLNSTLYPLTNSLSPSEKSNGARFNSTSTEIKKIKKKTKRAKFFKEIIVILFPNNIKIINKRLKRISKEIVCFLARREPNIPNFLFLVIPARING